MSMADKAKRSDADAPNPPNVSLADIRWQFLADINTKEVQTSSGHRSEPSHTVEKYGMVLGRRHQFVRSVDREAKAGVPLPTTICSSSSCRKSR
jgi:hypothetical protein